MDGETTVECTPDRSRVSRGDAGVLEQGAELGASVPVMKFVEASAARPVLPRGATRVFMVLLLAVIVGVGAAGFWSWSNPRVAFLNTLDRPVELVLQNELPVSVDAGATLVTRVSRRNGRDLRWTVIAPVNGDGQPMGTVIGASASLPFPSSPLGIVRARAEPRVDGDAYFAPRITNETGKPVRIIVNDGLNDGAGVSIEADCQCVVPSGATHFDIGYYRQFRNSTVLALAGDGSTAMFEDFAEWVDPATGVIPLRFAAGDLSP